MVAARRAQEKIYQDRYIGGRVVYEGTRECGRRYDAIVEVLRRHPPCPTVVDIGANQGYFSFRLAEDLGASCVMIEKQGDLLDNCIHHGGEKLILLQRTISARELSWLASRERFDAVLGLNVLHHFGWRWRGALRAVCALGDLVFVENPPDDDTGSRGRYVRRPINRRLEATPHELLCETARRRDRPIASRLLLLGNNELASRQRVREPASGRGTTSRPGESASVPAGLTLRSFQRLGGAYPRRPDLRRAIEALEDEHARKMAIDDIVVQGRSAAAIEPLTARSRAEVAELHDWLTGA